MECFGNVMPVYNPLPGHLCQIASPYDDDNNCVVVSGMDEDGPDAGIFTNGTVVLIVLMTNRLEGSFDDRVIVMTPIGVLGWVFTRELNLLSF